MGVFLRRTAAGLSPYWFGLWWEDGKRHETSLCKWKGTPPGPGEKNGDAAFEKSRGEAEALFKRIREGEKTEEERKVLERKVLASRYGVRVERLKIADLAARWDALPHKADLTEARRERVHSVLGRFGEFMGENFPNVKEAGALMPEHFQAFFEDVDKRGIPRKPQKGRGKDDVPEVEKGGVSARTWNDVLDILRGTLRKVDGNSRGFREYLADLPKRTESTVHRRPFDGAELDAIFTAAAEIDPELHPVLVAAACTALRRGDVCKLRWDAVDMKEGFVTVKTAKTGETVEIPIFPPFRVVLEEAAATRKKGVPYVWPKIALAYGRNADGLNHRLRKVLAAAGFVRPERLDAATGKYEAAVDAEAASAMVEDGMEREGWTAKRKAKARRMLALHFEGKNGKEIAEEVGTSKGGVSDYFKAMEEAGRVAIVSTPKRETPARATLAEIADGEQRQQRGSLCGWHSFRTTFCTLALANGVPMEILRKITGHRTAEIVLKHYDRRGREEMRKAFGAALPKAISGAIEGEVNRAGRKGRSGKPETDLSAIFLPTKVAGVAELLAGADQKTLAAVKRLLKKDDVK